MKQVLLFSFLGMGMLPLSSRLNDLTNNTGTLDYNTSFKTGTEGFNIGSQAEPGNEKMLAVIFKKQEFCRAELKDFEFDIQYHVVSATVYFSGTNFKSVEKGTINSNSLKPIRSLMERCAAGSMVVFDDVKVIGPDKQVRPIAGMSLLLH